MSRHQEGFTLFETVIALVVISAAIVTFYRGVALGSSSSRIANSEAAAAALASAKLAIAGVEPEFTDDAEFDGEDGPFVWRVKFAQFPPARDQLVSSGVVGYWVDVEVNWREGPLQSRRTLQLRTLKLGLR